jgi:uncharacterized RDD family membrane protein YckC
MDETDRYIQEVLRNIQASSLDSRRMEADLRAHIQEAAAAGEPLPQVLARMGTPLEVAEAFMAQRPMHYAGFWPRALASIIDMLIIFLAAGVLFLGAIPFSNLVPTHPQGVEYLLGALIILFVLACAAGALGVIIFYFPILEGRFGQTLGKRMLRLRVLREDGLPIHYKEAFLRRLSYYTEFMLFDALFIPFSSKKQRALDMVARTIVIRESL